MTESGWGVGAMLIAGMQWEMRSRDMEEGEEEEMKVRRVQEMERSEKMLRAVMALDLNHGLESRRASREVIQENGLRSSGH
eukprot:758784-Hanusia_phi.AAC.7